MYNRSVHNIDGGMNTFVKFVQLHRSKLKQTVHTDIEYARQKIPIQLGKDGLSTVRDIVTAGKMIRGNLVLLSAQLHDVPLTAAVYHTAAAVEILHTGLLIHDDIIDNDDTRRGKDSTFHHYQKEGVQLNATDPLRYGQSLALCVGDILFFLAINLISRQINDADRARRLISLISSEIQAVGAAEMLDAHLGQTDQDATFDDIEQVNLYKTARYTFSLPLMIGTLFRNETADPLLSDLGEHLGIIFQLKDDELGIFGEEKDIGKPVGSDIRENKKTLIRLRLFQLAPKKIKEKLTALFGNPSCTSTDIAFVRHCIDEYGVRQDIEKTVNYHLKEAERIMLRLKKGGMDTTLLSSLLPYNLTRNG